MVNLARQQHDGRKRWLDAVFESAPDGLFVCDLDGRCEDVSFAACTLLGRTKSEVLGRVFAEHVAAGHVPLWRLFVEQLRLHGHAQTDISLVRADATPLPVEIVGRCTGDGAPSIILFVRDARVRRHVESELARARAELESLSSTEGEVTEAIAELPQTGLDIALKTIAFQAEVLTGASVVALVLGDDPALPAARWVYGGSARPDDAHAAAVACARSAMREQRAARSEPAAGHAADVLAVPVVLRGRSEGAVVLADEARTAFDADDERVMRMIAARVAAALASARLYEGEAHEHAWLQSVFDQMPEGVTVFDANGEVVQQNPMARANGALCAPDGRPLRPEETPAARVLKSGETVSAIELAVRTEDGALLPVLVSAAPLSDGPRTGAVMLCREISALKQLERMREEWASIVAHDLRQPVGIVRMNADLLVGQIGDGLAPKQLEALRRIQSCTERLHRMIDDLADASLIEANRMRIEKKPVELTVVVERVVSSFAAAWEGRFDVRVERPAVALADEDRIEQVLGNLVGNAVKYGEAKSPVAIRVDGRAAELVVTVTNRGKGIAADELPLLFARFSRSKSARRSTTKGLGLGLYIARGLVEAHGGRIWAQSTPGETTTVAFSLPRAPIG